MEKYSIKIGTLFSGIGSPEQAASRVWKDYKIVFGCEIDKFARQSYLANYEIEEEHFHKDITKMDGRQYQGKCDILIGGSPCQSFSYNGLRKGLEDDRGKLIYEYVRVVKEVKAPIIIYENVKGLLSIDKGQTFKDFLRAIQEIGYHCHYKILNSKDFNVPQNRERIFLVGFLDPEVYRNFSFGPKQTLKKRLEDILEENVDEKYFLDEKWKEYIEIHQKIKEEQKKLKTKNSLDNFFTKNEETIEKHQVKIFHRNFNWKPGQTLREYKFYSPTLVTDPSNFIVFDQNKQIRKLTPLEFWRLQDFPDEAFFKTKTNIISDTQLYKQAGNSMTVAVVEMIFRQIDKALKQSKGNECH